MFRAGGERAVRPVALVGRVSAAGPPLSRPLLQPRGRRHPLLRPRVPCLAAPPAAGGHSWAVAGLVCEASWHVVSPGVSVMV